MRLIDADKLLQEIETLGKNAGFYKPIYDGLINTIKHAPSVDAEPVRHGQWIASRDEFCACSICKYPVYVGWNQTNYCPNCGAKMMDGGKQDD